VTHKKRRIFYNCVAILAGYAMVTTWFIGPAIAQIAQTLLGW
jgi:hypothetical protein